MEYFAYLLKTYLPWLFKAVSGVAAFVAGVRYGGKEQEAYRVARIEGTVGERSAHIRPLDISDAEVLFEFLNNLPESHLQYFRPHGFERTELRKVLRSSAFLKYGLFQDNKLKAYALLKLTPVGSAFIGRLVSPELNGLGLGKFLANYLYWQASMIGVVPHSTISKYNMASLKSHQAVAEYEIVKSLPNDFLLIRFTPKPSSPPKLIF